VQSQVVQHVAVRSALAFQAFFPRVKAGAAEPGYPPLSRPRALREPHRPTSAGRLPRGGPTAARGHRRARPGARASPLGGHAHDGDQDGDQDGDHSAQPQRQVVRLLLGRVCRAGAPAAHRTAGGPCCGPEDLRHPLDGPADRHPPRCCRSAERALARVQRRLSNAEKGTSEHAERRTIVARVPERMAWRRGAFAHQHRRCLVTQCDRIAVEDVSVTRMRHSHCLATSRARAAWTPFATSLSYTAAWAGRRSVAVHPADTSQDGSLCGQRQKLSLSDRISTCPCCGLMLDRDLNAARNRVRLGRQSLASAEMLPPKGGSVVTRSLFSRNCRQPGEEPTTWQESPAVSGDRRSRHTSRRSKGCVHYLVQRGMTWTGCGQAAVLRG
jgi:hypothetical protein